MSQPLFLLASRGLRSDRGRDPDLEQNIEADELQNRGNVQDPLQQYHWNISWNKMSSGSQWKME